MINLQLPCKSYLENVIDSEANFDFDFSSQNLERW